MGAGSLRYYAAVHNLSIGSELFLFQPEQGWLLLRRNSVPACYNHPMNTQPVPENIRLLERPDPALWKYYLVRAVLTGPGIIASLPYLYFKYHTLRYRFDEEGIHMK